MFENSKNDTESPYANQCASIAAYYNEIEDLRARIALVKEDPTDAVVTVDAAPAEKVCPACGEKLDPEAKFCSKCGASV